jgi:hypothetical protein
MAAAAKDLVSAKRKADSFDNDINVRYLRRSWQEIIVDVHHIDDMRHWAMTERAKPRRDTTADALVRLRWGWFRQHAA